jgi:hypothetical protein
MENSIGSRSASLAWKLALLLPLAPAVVLQLISQRQTDLRAGVKISMIGNIFLCVSMITQSLYLMRKSMKWGIMLLIFSGVVLGFGLHVVLRSLLEVDAEGTYIHAQGRLPDPREYLAGAASAQFSRRSLA